MLCEWFTRLAAPYNSHMINRAQEAPTNLRCESVSPWPTCDYLFAACELACQFLSPSIIHAFWCTSTIIPGRLSLSESFAGNARPARQNAFLFHVLRNSDSHLLIRQDKHAEAAAKTENWRIREFLFAISRVALRPGFGSGIDFL